LVDLLEKIGVKQICGLIGESLSLIGNAVRYSNIEWIGVRRASKLRNELNALALSELGKSRDPGDLTRLQSLRLVAGVVRTAARKCHSLGPRTPATYSKGGHHFRTETPK
jgi:hypothetical protein